MLYQFECSNCGHNQEELFPASEYDAKVVESVLVDISCEKCGTNSLVRNIITMPGVLGGTKGYVSVERYLSRNPDQKRRKEEQLNQKITNRRQKRIYDKIDKQSKKLGPSHRDKDYGSGKETKLDI